MADSAIDVQYVANLARLHLSPEEVQQFQKQLADILGYVDLLQKADVSGIETETAGIVETNNLRPDIAGESLTVAAALANAPRQSGNLIQLPKIVE